MSAPLHKATQFDITVDEEGTVFVGRRILSDFGQKHGGISTLFAWVVGLVGVTMTVFLSEVIALGSLDWGVTIKSIIVIASLAPFLIGTPALFCLYLRKRYAALILIGLVVVGLLAALFLHVLTLLI